MAGEGEMIAPAPGMVAMRASVDWAAIFAGAAVATAAGLVLITFGTALGMTVTSPYEGEGLSPVAFAIAAGLWLLWVQILSFGAGGYVAARLRPRMTDLTEHEVDVRDGLHGVLVWAVGVIAAAFIAFATAGGATTAARTADMRGDLAASAAAVASENVNAEAAKEAATNPNAANATTPERRAEVARKLAIISAFITAASLLAGLVMAIFAAGSGGRHRDENTHIPLFVLRTPATTPVAKP